MLYYFIYIFKILVIKNGEIKNGEDLNSSIIVLLFSELKETNHIKDRVKNLNLLRLKLRLNEINIIYFIYPFFFKEISSIY